MEAYLCHLRDLFPVSVTNPQDQTWRDRVQELEDALREMKAVVESERIEALALRSLATTPSYASDTVTDPSAFHGVSSSKKKKGKKSVSSARIPGPLPSVEDKADLFLKNNDDHSKGRHTSLVKPLKTLQILVERCSLDTGSERPPAYVLTGSLVQCIDALGYALVPTFAASQPSTRSARLPFLPTVSDTLTRILWHTFPHLLHAYSGKRKSATTANSAWDGLAQVDGIFRVTHLEDGASLGNALDAIFGSLCACIHVPAIRSIIASCSTRVNTCLHSTKKPTNTRGTTTSPQDSYALVDPIDIVHLLHTARTVLDNIVSDTAQRFSKHWAELVNSVQSLYNHVALESIRELDRLFEPSPPADISTLNRNATPPPSQSSLPSPDVQTPSKTSSHILQRKSRHTRNDRLCRREALHHLCYIISLYLEPPPGVLSSTRLDSVNLLRNALEGNMGKFLRERLGGNIGHSFETVTGSRSRSSARDERDDPFEMDEAEEGMVLAVLEKAWNVGLDLNVGLDG